LKIKIKIKVVDNLNTDLKRNSTKTRERGTYFFPCTNMTVVGSRIEIIELLSVAAA